MSRRRIAAFGKWFATLVVLASIAVVILQRRPSILLIDGSTASFLGIVSGTNAYVHGNLFQKAVWLFTRTNTVRLGQYKLTTPVSIQMNHRTDTDVTALFSIVSTNAQSFGRNEHFRSVYRFTAVNKDGRIFPNYFWQSHIKISPREELVMLPLRFYPRNEQKLMLRLETFHFDGKWVPLREFVVPNPYLLETPKWITLPRPLPQTNITEEVEVVMEEAGSNEGSARTGVQMSSAVLRLGQNPGFSSMLRLQIRSADAHNERYYEVIQCTGEDAFGNRVEFRKSAPTTDQNRSNPVHLRGHGGLHADKPWRIRLTLAPNRASITHEDYFEFKNLTIPAIVSGSPRSWTGITLTNRNRLQITATVSSLGGLQLSLNDPKGEKSIIFADVFCGEHRDFREVHFGSGYITDGKQVDFPGLLPGRASSRIWLARPVVMEFLVMQRCEALDRYQERTWI